MFLLGPYQLCMSTRIFRVPFRMLALENRLAPAEVILCRHKTFQALDSMILLLHCNFMISLKKKKVTALSILTILWVISYIAGTLLRWPDENELISSRVSPQQGYRIPRTVIGPSLLCRIWNFPRLCFYLLSFPIASLSFRGLHSHSWISSHFHLSSSLQLSHL